MCRWAREELKRVAPPGTETASTTEYATDRAVKGIGSNVLSEKGRLTGIKAYTECIQRFALEGLLTWLLQQGDLGMLEETALENEFRSAAHRNNTVESAAVEDINTLYSNVESLSFPWESSSGTDSPLLVWRYQKALLRDEFLSNNDDVVKWVADLLETLIVLEKNYADKIYQCKKRDDKRGATTIPGYAISHIAAEADSVIKEAQKAAEDIETTATQLIATLKQNQRSRL
jgi:hypothetical protein